MTLRVPGSVTALALARAVVLGLASLAGEVGQVQAGEPVKFAPHRAVYDVTLARAAPGSGVSDMAGRLVYELRGSACEGYTQQMRFVTTSSASDGSEQINDMRSTTFEEAFGRKLRFNSTQYRDEEVAEVTQGQAGRRETGGAAGEVNVELTKPEKRVLSLPGSVYFPIQHSIAMLEAAKAGKQLFVADVYDGSEKGDKVSATNTIIGAARDQSKDSLPPGLANADRLKPLKFWPIATSYFEKDKSFDKKDALPNYEMAAHFYENGVSTRLLMDYGDFSLKGELTELTFLAEPECVVQK
jgi:EipB-like